MLEITVETVTPHVRQWIFSKFVMRTLMLGLLISSTSNWWVGTKYPLADRF
jgi:hypothetical protein